MLYAECMKMYAEGVKMYTEGVKMYAEGVKMYTTPMMINYIYLCTRNMILKKRSLP